MSSENPTHFSLKFVGDITINSNLSEEFSRDMVEALKSSYTFGNLESPVTLSGKSADKWAALKQKPTLVKELSNVNINGVSLANNHMFDYGEAGLLDTFKNLKKDTIDYAGAGLNLKEALSPIELNLGGTVVRIYSVATTLPLESAASNERPGIAPIRVKCTYYFDGVAIQEQPGTPPTSSCFVDESDIGRIKRIVRENRKRSILSVVCIHWGMPYQHNLMDYQKDIAHSLVNAGAELIIGHHPHVLQQVEKYKGKFIFYSLGNFIWQPSGKRMGISSKWNFWPPQYGKWGMSADSAIVEVLLSEGIISGAKITPVVIKQGIPNLVESSSIQMHEVYKDREDLFPDLDTEFYSNYVKLG